MRIFYLCIIVMLLIGKTFALNFIEQNPQYAEYIKKAKIHDFSDNNKIIKKVAKKWKSKEDLKIRIFGDSHIAGDFITSELRNILGNTNAIGFTYPLMPTYHQNLLLSYQNQNFIVLDSRQTAKSLTSSTNEKILNNIANIDYPMGGVIAIPQSLPASITLNSNSKQLSTDNQMFITQIIFKNDSVSPAFNITDSEQRFYEIRSETPNTWEIARLELTLPITINALSENVMFGGYFIQQTQNNNIIESIGINGVRSDIWLKWNAEIFKRELDLLEYDIIMLCYGSNDAMYETFNEGKFIANYSELISLLNKTNPNALIILISPPPVVFASGKLKNKYRYSQTFTQIQEAIKKVAMQQHIVLFDIDEFITQTGTKKAWINLNLSKKDVHLTPSGYRLLAHGIYFSLQKKLQEK
ncbi:hypothetical protein CQA53_07400 [Helicobacter didelphidarum]|uniref:Uncharacterized protein n=1 Tax=Helicobacter didelphidarum TaxID=2040648 RepID=A0A3D8IIA1_9HELI|nr:GDSL-type esterase/lipase family protein [Helicobacter didelphidarum]RDU64888.1 hypothetical protein CQA53_07400 [Helicobacter didelphidarum]